jgi:hypothetical protein
VQSIDELLELFQKSSQDNFHTFNHVQDLNQQKDRLEEQIRDIEQQLSQELVKPSQEVQEDNKRKDILNQMHQSLLRTEDKVKEYEQRTQSVRL